ncbi:hypothetical protein [Rhodoplanes elegans]|uniref:hypothetical protein n=1 Tax=Rhodoplanes elegans TaxID=29408 RepID=UPI0011B93EC5|nr:hypothetical protein [Rhodoplanes elegans]
MTVEIDPIFAAIEAHRHAQAAFEDAGVAELPCLPLEAAAGRAAWGLLTVLPTTPAGLLTFIDCNCSRVSLRARPETIFDRACGS